MTADADPSISRGTCRSGRCPSDCESHRQHGGSDDPPESIADVGVTTSEPVPSGLKITAGGVLLWGGTVAIGVSTVVLLAVLSRHLHHQGFTGLSTLFGLFFVASLIPSGIPFRAAALAVDGAPPMRMTATHVGLLAAAGAAVSPIVAYALHLPVLAVLLVAAQVIVAIPLAIRRGSLIAAHRFDANGREPVPGERGRGSPSACSPVSPGASTASLLGLAVATGIALIAVPSRRSSPVRTARQMTSLLDTWLALVLLGLFVQLDILIAPSVLTHSAATRYDLAAVPSKGVYIVLIAVSTLIFPVRADPRAAPHGRPVRLRPLSASGLVVTGILAALRGTIAAVLGQNVASLPLLVALGAAMSIAGATGIVINGGIALGVATAVAATPGRDGVPPGLLVRPPQRRRLRRRRAGGAGGHAPASRPGSASGSRPASRRSPERGRAQVGRAQAVRQGQGD